MSTPEESAEHGFGELGRILVIIPTYNEAENVEPIVARVRDAVPESREILSRGGNIYTRLALGIPLQDATGGYRRCGLAYRAEPVRGLFTGKTAANKGG